MRMSMREPAPPTLAALHGALPPAAVMCLGHRLAAVASDIPFDPSRIVIVDDLGGVQVQPGPVDVRWRAPEVRASLTSNPTTAELWSLGRLLLELSLGHAVDDDVADHADDVRLRGLKGLDGQALPERVVDVLAALLNPHADERLQSPRAAERVLKDAEQRFGDGASALRAAFAPLRNAGVGDGIVTDDDDAPVGNGIGRADLISPVTMNLASRDIFDPDHLQRLAEEAEAKRRESQKQKAGLKGTADLPARAILSPDELKRIGASASREEQRQMQKQLPTQLVTRDRTAEAAIAASDEVVDVGPAAAALPAPPKPKLLTGSTTLPDTPEASAALAQASTAALAPLSDDDDEEVTGFVTAERKRRNLLLAAAAAVVVVLVLAVVLSGRGDDTTLTPTTTTTTKTDSAPAASNAASSSASNE